MIYYTTDKERTSKRGNDYDVNMSQQISAQKMWMDKGQSVLKRSDSRVIEAKSRRKWEK